jgi:hypothetical protein
MESSLYQYEVTLSLLTNFGLMFALSDMIIAIPACFCAPFAWKIFFYPFTLSLFLFLLGRYVSYKATNCWSSVFF